MKSKFVTTKTVLISLLLVLAICCLAVTVALTYSEQVAEAAGTQTATASKPVVSVDELPDEEASGDYGIMTIDRQLPSVSDGFILYWNSASNGETLQLGGNTTIEQDIVLTGKSITLDLYGYHLDMDGHSITINKGATLTIIDTDPNYFGGPTYVYLNGSTTTKTLHGINGGVITSSSTGTPLVVNGGTLNLGDNQSYGAGTICGVRGGSGSSANDYISGVIYICENGTVNMYDSPYSSGTTDIAYNYGEDYGVIVHEGGTFNMYGGYIYSNSGETGIFYMYGWDYDYRADLYMKGGSISSNYTYAAVYLNYYCTFHMSGGYIQNNDAYGVSVNNGSFYVSGKPVIKGNTRKGEPANVVKSGGQNYNKIVIEGTLNAGAEIHVSDWMMNWSGVHMDPFTSGYGKYVSTSEYKYFYIDSRSTDYQGMNYCVFLDTPGQTYAELCWDIEWEYYIRGHSWGDYTGTTTHSRTCNKCKQTDTTTSHSANWGSWSKVTSGSTTYHKRICNTCQLVDQHTSTSNLGTWTKTTSGGKTYHVQNCKTCNTEVNRHEDAVNLGKWEDKTESGTTYHVQNCNTCSQEVYRHKADSDLTGWSESDSNHVRTCNTCDRVVYTHGKNSNVGEWTKSGSLHVKPCKSCTLYVDQHSSTSNVSTTWKEGGSDHVRTCNTCSQIVYQHSPSPGDWGLSGAKHVQLCTECPLKLGEHDPSAGDWTTSGSYHVQECKNCDVAISQHGKDSNWGAWSTVDGNHQRECNTCQLKDTAHGATSNLDDWITNNSEHIQRCKTCQLPVYKHGKNDYLGDWDTSGSEHVQKCTNCQQTVNKHESNWGDWSLVGDDHERTCGTCQEKDETHGATSDLGEWKTSSSYHIQKCNTCDLTVNRHGQTQFLGDWAAASDAEHVQKCTACQQTVNRHESNWGDWALVDGNHERICDTCELKDTTHGARSNLGSWTPRGSEHIRKCNTCQLTVDRHNADNWGEWAVVEGNHQRACNSCTVKSTHEPGAPTVGTADVGANTHTGDCSEGCGLPVTAEHSYGAWYDNNDDLNHAKRCPVCQDVITAAHDYLSSLYYDGGEEGHYRICTIAGCEHHSAKTSHNLGVLLSDGPIGHYNECEANGCEYETQRTAHTYKWTPNDDKHVQTCEDGCPFYDEHSIVGTNWVSDGDDTHTGDCAFGGCEIKVTADHGYGTAYYDEGDGNHHQECTDCGRPTESVEHTYNEQIGWQEGEQGKHVNYCTLCLTGHKEHTPRVTKWTNDENNSTHSSKCDRCSIVMIEEHDLSGSLIDAGKDVGHYRECGDGCGYTTEIQVHHIESTWSEADGYHFYGCSDGCNLQDQKGLHDVDVWKDNEDGTHIGYCSVCKMSRASAPHNVEDVETFKGDYNSHWNVCKDCGARANEVTHNWATDYEWLADSEGNHYKYCEDCGTTALSYVHSLQKVEAVAQDCVNPGTREYYTCTQCGLSFTDEEGHNQIANLTRWKTVGGGGYIKPDGHKYNDSGICSVCGDYGGVLEDMKGELEDKKEELEDKQKELEDELEDVIGKLEDPNTPEGDKPGLENKRKELEDKLKEIQDAIDGIDGAIGDLEDAMEDGSNLDKVDEAIQNGKDALGDAEDQLEDGLKDAKDKAKKELEKEAERKKKEIEEDPTLSDEEKKQLEDEIDKELEDAQRRVDQVTDPDDLDGIVSEGKERMDDVVEEYEPAHVHDWSDELSHDATGHWYGCKTQGCDARKDFTAHSLDTSKPVTSNGTETHTGECVCGVAFTEAHTWMEGWQHNNETHYRECEICHAHKDEAAHSVSDWTSDGVSGHHGDCDFCNERVDAEHRLVWEQRGNDYWQVCNDHCGYEFGPVEHRVEAWVTDGADTHHGICEDDGITLTENHTWVQKSDATHHWEECSKCHEEKADSRVAHTLASGTSAGAQLHTGTCSECGKEVTQNHVWDEENWVIDDTVHFHECTVCGAHKDEAAHSVSNWTSDEEDGEHFHKGNCDDCGKEIVEEHDWLFGTCRVCGDKLASYSEEDVGLAAAAIVAQLLGLIAVAAVVSRRMKK